MRDWLSEARDSLRAGNAAAAIAACRARISEEPLDADAWFLAAVAYGETSDLVAATQAMDKAFRLRPDMDPSRRLAYASLLLDTGSARDAELQARAALQASPDSARGLNVLGLALRAQGLWPEALEAFEKAHKADPSHRFASANLARAYGHVVRLEDEIEAYRRAIAADDRNAELWCDLGNALANSGRQMEAAEAYRESLRRDPAFHQVGSNLLVQLHYDPGVGPEEMHAAHLDWSQRHAAGIPVTAHRPRTKPSRVRIGFLSPRFHWGPTASFLLQPLAHLDRQRFEVHLLDLFGASDGTSEGLARHADQWHYVGQDSDDALAEGIRRLGLDILIDLAGHNPGGRPRVLARKPAPVIATWLDYFNTTGLSAVDYLISDSISTPPGGSQRFTERVLRLDPCRLCYSPPEYAPPVSDSRGARTGVITFGTFNRLSKVTPAVIALWGRVLLQVPGSRILLKNRAFLDPRTRERIAAIFAAEGVEGDRLDFRGDSPHAQMLAEYGDIDIALDSFPHNGGLTTCEALWMGVPVLTFPGDSMISRQGATLLSAAGLADWIADDEADLIRRAVMFAGRPDVLAGMRREMRDRLRNSALMDGAGFARRFSALMEEIA